jgi:hypothetical protein
VRAGRDRRRGSLWGGRGGFSVEEVLSLTGMTADVADDIGVMQEN